MTKYQSHEDRNDKWVIIAVPIRPGLTGRLMILLALLAGGILLGGCNQKNNSQTRELEVVIQHNYSKENSSHSVGSFNFIDVTAGSSSTAVTPVTFEDGVVVTMVVKMVSADADGTELEIGMTYRDPSGRTEQKTDKRYFRLTEDNHIPFVKEVTIGAVLTAKIVNGTPNRLK